MKRGIGLPILCLFLALAALPARDVSAQPPPDAPLVVKVTTDKSVYAPGEVVRIRVSATNLLNSEQVLHFSSGKLVDYVVDGLYRWSDGRAFTLDTPSLRLAPGETKVFPEFVHEASSHFLEPERRHEIIGEVTGHGRASTTIFVSSGDAPSKFELTPIVRPNPAPFGAAIHFALSVRNVTDQPLTFGHDGCPVHFRVDGQDMPPIACAEYWKQVTLAPGQSARFGPEEYPYLSFGSDRNAFHLAPGTHRVDLEIPGVGMASARFQVLPAPGGGAITGQVSDQEGVVVAGATIQAFSPSTTDSVSLNSAFATWQAYSGRDGSYRLDNIPGGRYLVRAFTANSTMIWFKQVEVREQATPVPVTEGGVTSAIDFVLKRSPEPPTYPGGIAGAVYASSDRVDARIPIPNAVVAAFPLRPGDGGSSDPPTPGPLPPLPPEGPGVYFGFTGAWGEFHIPLPYGAYRLIAFAEGHRYEWFQNAETFETSVPYGVSPNARQTPALFFLPRLAPNDHPSRIAGVVMSISLPSPTTSSVSEPVVGAFISARPLVLDPRIAYFREVVYEARSGNDGSYSIEVPPTVPCIVDARHDLNNGQEHRQQFYDHVADRAGARPVDLFPGRTAANINFDLRNDGIPPPPLRGVISGYIYSDNGTDGPLRPLPGAVVRLRAADDFPVPHERITRSDANGRYLFSGLSTTSVTPPRYIVSAEADGHVPNYYPGVYQWTTAQPVEPVSAEARVVTNLTLYQPIGRTSFLTVGFVRARHESGVPPVEGDSAETGLGSAGPAAARSLIEYAETVVLDEPLGPKPLPGAYFYLFPAAAAGIVDPQPMAGGVTSANGTVVMENLPPGVYRAYADRPGYLVGWYGGVGGTGLITVGEGHAPVLADILMSLKFPPPGPPSVGAGNAMVRDLHNAPNPFRPHTTIMYQLVAAAEVTLNVFDVNGRLVRTLVDRAQQFAGQQTVAWDGRDASGAAVGAGIYFYRVQTPIETTVGKMVRAR